MGSFSIEYGMSDGQPWAALLTQSSAGPLSWEWTVYGVAFTPRPEVTVESATMSFATVDLPGES